MVVQRTRTAAVVVIADRTTTAYIRRTCTVRWQTIKPFQSQVDERLVRTIRFNGCRVYERTQTQSTQA